MSARTLGNMEDKVIINCDWLQYSVILAEDEPEFLCPNGFRLEVMQGNNIFRNRIIVWDLTGRKWLTLLWSPFSSRLNKRLMTVQVANELLYSSAINQSYRILQEIVECKYNSLGRVDVCCDFQMDRDKMLTLRHLNSGHYYIQAKSEGSVWWHNENKFTNGREFNEKSLHCQTWGSHKSQITIKCYYKSREQGMLCDDPQPDKPYIVQMWRDANWDVRNVWRLEFSMTKVSKGRYDNKHIGLEEISSCEWLQHLFYEFYTHRFIVRQNTGRRSGKKNEDPIKTFLNLSQEIKHFTWSVGDHKRPPSSDAVKVLRTMMSSIQNPTIVCNQEVSEHIANAIITHVESQRLDSYFHNHYGQSVRDFMQKYYDQSGQGIFEVDGHPDKTWN